MITAVDTNILLDVFLPDEKFAPDSSKLLKLAYDDRFFKTSKTGIRRGGVGHLRYSLC